MDHYVNLSSVPSIDDPWAIRHQADRPATSGGKQFVVQAERLAREKDFVLSRGEMAGLGLSRFDVDRQVARGRWVKLGLHSISVHRGPLTERGLWRHALQEVGSRAALDGGSALTAAGLQGYNQPVHISVPHGWQPRRIPGVVVKELRDWESEDVIAGDIRRTRPPLAAIREATWRRTHRQAALVLLMTAQQRIVRGADLFEATKRFKRMRRRAVIEGVVADIMDGVQSLGELDFALECRRRGLPEPSRQVIRKGRNGRAYLDVYFDDYKIVVEIEGAHHDGVINSIDDALRQNQLIGGQEDFLRIPVIGFRTDREAFMQQLEAKLRARGWRPS